MFVRKSPDSEEAKNKHVDDTKAVIDEVADEGALLWLSKDGEDSTGDQEYQIERFKVCNKKPWPDLLKMIA